MKGKKISEAQKRVLMEVAETISRLPHLAERGFFPGDIFPGRNNSDNASRLVLERLAQQGFFEYVSLPSTRMRPTQLFWDVVRTL